MLQKRAIRTISSAGYIAHTEPLSKFYNVLKVEDIYNYRLLVLYYNLKYKNVPYHISSFLPKSSIARERYPIRNSRFQPPLHAHEYIAKTCKYRLPVFLNSLNNIRIDLTQVQYMYVHWMLLRLLMELTC